MKSSSDKKIKPVKEASSGAQALMLNVLAGVAEKDKDHALARNVKRRQKARKA
ncbi:hypothetical protein D3C78_1548270 [compost metagenome]